jgi:hypothetical protein
MSSNTVLDFCVLDSCSEDGQVKGGDGGFVYLVSRVVGDPC